VTARAALAAALLVAGACAPAAPPAPSPAASADSGAFVVRFGADTVAVERYRRDARRLTGELVIREPRTAIRRYTADLRPDGSIRRLHIDLRTLGGPTPRPPYSLDYEFGADSATEVFTEDTLRETRRIATPAPVWPELRYSLALREQALRSARGGYNSYPVAADSVVPVRTRALGGDTLLLTSIDGPMTAVMTGGSLRSFDGMRSTVKVTGERVAMADVAGLAAAFALRDRAGRGIGQLSPRDSVSLRVRGGSVMVAYGRPSLRGRPAVGGVLVPWNEVWRTGANTPTHLATDVALDLAGTALPPGRYSLFTLPSPGGWKLIVNRRLGGSGRDYDAASDVARVPVATAALPEPVEQLTTLIEPVGENGGIIRIRWERTEIRIPFTTR